MSRPKSFARRLWLAPLAAALASVLGACAVFVPDPDPSDAGGDEAALAELRHGRRIYVEKCAGCHRLYDVDAYGDEAWRGHVREMVSDKRVRLTGGEHGALLRYLTSMNSKPRP